jgi:16S rRNA (uracil1498-N3)-methyltransferase
MIFYTPDIEGTECVLSDEESGHAVKVLRLKKGDTVTLVDGKGGWYDAIVTSPHPKHCEVTVSNTIHEYEKLPYRLHIAISPTKNMDRFEWFVEKSVEIGIDEITPILCEHSERKHVNMSRLQKIAIAAMKQSKKAYLPVIHEPTPFSRLIETPVHGKKSIAYCGNGDKYALKEIYGNNEDIIIVIGPEGDFSPGEVAMALKNSYHCITLGKSRLRTETAGVVACHSIYFLNH